MIINKTPKGYLITAKGLSVHGETFGAALLDWILINENLSEQLNGTVNKL